MVSPGEACKRNTGEIQHSDVAVAVPDQASEDSLLMIREFRVPMGEHQYGLPQGCGFR